MKWYNYFGEQFTILETIPVTQELHLHMYKIYVMFFISIACDSKKLETMSTNRRVYVFGGPLTTLRFNDLLEERTKFSKAVILMVMVYHSERLEIKISNRERHIRQSPGDNRHEFLVVLLQWSSIDTTASLSNSV